jgi:hypothetical protein
LLGLYEERKNDGSDETQHLIIILLFFSFLTCVFSGITIMYITIHYVNCSGELMTEYVSSYRPFGWAGIGLSFIPLGMFISKIFDYLGNHSEV